METTSKFGGKVLDLKKGAMSKAMRVRIRRGQHHAEEIKDIKMPCVLAE
jgi:hypothetical protein